MNRFAFLSVAVLSLFSINTQQVQATLPTLTGEDWGKFAVGMIYAGTYKGAGLLDNSPCFDFTWDLGDKLMGLVGSKKQRDVMDWIMFAVSIASMVYSGSMSAYYCISTDPLIT